MVGTKPSNEYQILQHLSTVGYPIGPSEIASFTEINPNTVRARLSDLMDKGLISRPSWGKYTINPIHGTGMIGGGPRAQNVVMQVPAQVVSSDEVKLRLGRFLSYHIWFGLKRKRITYRIGVPYGIDLLGLVAVHRLVEIELEKRGYDLPSWDDWMLVDCEFFTDYSGFKMEGLQSVTFSGFLGQLEKYYQKPGVRREIRVGDIKGVGLRTLVSFWEGGLDMAQMNRRMESIEREMNLLRSSVKGGNRMVQATFEAFIRRGPK